MATRVKFGPSRRTKKKARAFDPTPQQQKIFNWFEGGKGNMVVRARAGCGKTSTIIEAIELAPEKRILLCAFNKSIARELQGRVANPNAEAKTLHSIGYGVIRRYWDRVSIDRDRADKLAARVCGNAPDPLKRLCAKLHTKGREMAPLAEVADDLMPIAYAYDCVPDELWEEEGYDVKWLVDRALEAMDIAAKEKPMGGIDFADMLYLPVRNRWLRPRYDLVVVDEAQDMNATQLIIAQGVCKGRMAVVGDDRQAIYAFRGADSGSLDRLKTDLMAKEFGLTMTFRCGKNIVSEAQTLVEDFIAHDDNKDGEVVSLGYEALADEVEVGDFVLSRKNAPLARTALGILKEGKRCHIQGRDIGQGLIRLVRRQAKGRAASSMPEFLARLEKWRAREVERVERPKNKGAEAKVEKVNDQAGVITALSEGLSGVRELITRIEDLFDDRSDRPSVLCSSVHRAKGLEADRVFVLADTLNPGIPCKCGHWPSVHRTGRCNSCACGGKHTEDDIRRQEEVNIHYVAITRAKTTLVMVRGGAK